MPFFGPVTINAFTLDVYLHAVVSVCVSAAGLCWCCSQADIAAEK